jgi:hypothetical protein
MDGGDTSGRSVKLPRVVRYRKGARGLKLVTAEVGRQVIGQKSLRSRGGWSEFSVENS